MKMSWSCTPWLCVIGARAAKLRGSAINPNRHLSMSKVLARWVPRMLPDEQKWTRLDISRYILITMRIIQAMRL